MTTTLRYLALSRVGPNGSSKANDLPDGTVAWLSLATPAGHHRRVPLDRWQLVNIAAEAAIAIRTEEARP